MKQTIQSIALFLLVLSPVWSDEIYVYNSIRCLPNEAFFEVSAFPLYNVSKEKIHPDITLSSATNVSCSLPGNIHIEVRPKSVLIRKGEETLFEGGNLGIVRLSSSDNGVSYIGWFCVIPNQIYRNDAHKLVVGGCLMRAPVAFPKNELEVLKWLRE
jgi:hypothetical protein